jgi:hypothetical protein
MSCSFFYFKCKKADETLIIIVHLDGSGSQPGILVPLGVREKVTGVREIQKNAQKKPLRVEFLIWGYAKGI